MPKRLKDLSGQKFGHLAVLKLVKRRENDGFYHSYWKCRCDCGNIRYVRPADLLNGKVVACSDIKNCKYCQQFRHMRSEESHKHKDLTGKRFGHLLAKKRVIVKTDSGYVAKWLCQCDCGGTILVRTGSLTNGRTKNCHGKNGHKCRYYLLARQKPPKHYLKDVKWLMNEVDLKKNKKYGIDIYKLGVSSYKRIWWRCPYDGYSWQAPVDARYYKHTKCPVCAQRNKTSFAEQAIFFYIKQAFPDAINNDHHFGRELDTYIPSLKVGIEYDGSLWHLKKGAEKSDNIKNKFCYEHGIQLIRIREAKLNLLTNYNCINFRRIHCNSKKTLANVIKEILSYLGVKNINVNIVRDELKIQKMCANLNMPTSIRVTATNNLEAVYPQYAAQWDKKKNAYGPDQVTPHSKYEAYWHGKCGHTWRRRVDAEVAAKGQCPKCYKKKMKTNKAVVCQEIKKVFINYKVAFELMKPQLNLKSFRSVLICCEHYRNQYTAGGFHFRWATKSEANKLHTNEKVTDL